MSVHKYIRTHSGAKYYFARPTVAQIKLEDILWSLSRMPRFLGHTDGLPYSTLQHLCLTHDLAPDDCKPEAAGHDFVEFALTDIVSPLKVLLPDYIDMERRHEKTMARRFGFRYPYPAAVKVADLTALATEMRWLTNRTDYKDLPYPPSKTPVVPWSPEKARREFMRRWSKLPVRA